MKGLVFDMDDTLFKEHEYRLSGWRLIAKCFAASCSMSAEELYQTMLRNAPLAFETVSNLSIANNVKITVDDQLAIYRSQMPDIHLTQDAKFVLEALKKNNEITLGLITDGRPVGQLNKIAALGLRNYIDDKNIIVTALYNTDKHSAFAYELIMQRNLEVNEWIYVGDNPTKDFRHANSLGWKTIMLSDNCTDNIFNQSFDDLAVEYHPQCIVSSLKQILELL